MESILVLTLLFLGLYGGTGFFVVMGGNPALVKMSSRSFAEYWQQVDSYMAVRMRIFGPSLLLTVLCSSVILYTNYSSISFWCMSVAFAILIADIVVIFRSNHPLNQLIQRWDLKALPGNVQEIKEKVISAFWLRSLFMISAFVMGLIAFWRR